MAIAWELYGRGLNNAADTLVKSLQTRDIAGALTGVDLTSPDGALQASKILISKGKMQEGMTLAQLAMQERNRREELGMRREDLGLRRQAEERQGSQFNRQFDLSQQQFGQTQKQQDRAYELQRATAQERPKVEFVDDGNGGKKPVKIMPNGQVQAITVTNQNGEPAPPDVGNPYGGGKFNADQGKAAGFSDRMLQSEGILSGINGVGGISDAPMGRQGWWDSTVSGIPKLGNTITSEKYQKYEQAQRDFINAQLRRESGAAISSGEFDSAKKQYFPQPGDTPAVVEQKAANRRASIEAMGREGGQSYRPRYVFDEKGRVVPFKGAPPQGQSQPGAASRPSQSPAATPQGANPKVLGPAPQGSPEGRTGSINGQKIVVRNGMIELAE